MPLWLVAESQLAQWRERLGAPGAAWVARHGFQAERARVVTIPDARGELAAAAMGLGPQGDAARPSIWDGAACAERLPAGKYALATPLPDGAATQFALGWLLGSYRFSRYRSQPKPAHAASLVTPPGCDARYALAAAEAMGWARDLVNMPANELGPAELAQAAEGLAREFGGQCVVTTGEDLRREYPLVHAVGQGSSRAPRFIDCRWPRPGAPRVTHRRQGRVLRFRRTGSQALGQHAADEEGHGRRGLRAGPGAPAAGDGRAHPVAVAHSGRREQRRRRCLPAGRRLDFASRPDRRDRQHRRRGAPGAGRRPGGSRYRASRPADRPGDADGRCAHRARPRPAGSVCEPGRARRSGACSRRGRVRSALADAPVVRLRGRAQQPRRGPQQRLAGAVCRRHHRGAVPQALRDRDAGMAARRPVRLESQGSARAGRRAPRRRGCAPCTH